ncbi:MAG: hypothetical protein PHO55_13945 [Thiomonas arsenitoxydans]|nr:hypothetical protein [Thiomonas arsenitoxydans]
MTNVEAFEFAEAVFPITCVVMTGWLFGMTPERKFPITCVVMTSSFSEKIQIKTIG